MTPEVKAAVMFTLLLSSCYVLTFELYQLYKNGLAYFFEVWNYLDFLPPVLILVFMELDTTGYFIEKDPNGELINLTTKAIMQAVMSLFIWLKLLYFLRIFESTGYLIRIII